MKNIILCTTKWDELVNKRVAEYRVEELKEGYWEKALEMGAHLAHHDNTQVGRRDSRNHHGKRDSETCTYDATWTPYGALTVSGRNKNKKRCQLPRHHSGLVCRGACVKLASLYIVPVLDMSHHISMFSFFMVSSHTVRSRLQSSTSRSRSQILSRSRIHDAKSSF